MNGAFTRLVLSVIRIFWVRATECMCAQTRPRLYTHIRNSFGGMESEPVLTPRKNPLYLKKFSPEEYWTHDAASSRTTSPPHYQRAIAAPIHTHKQGQSCFQKAITSSQKVCHKVHTCSDPLWVPPKAHVHETVPPKAHVRRNLRQTTDITIRRKTLWRQ